MKTYTGPTFHPPACTCHGAGLRPDPDCPCHGLIEIVSSRFGVPDSDTPEPSPQPVPGGEGLARAAKMLALLTILALLGTLWGYMAMLAWTIITLF